MKRQYLLDMQGTKHHWSFDVMVDPQHLEEWRADGLILHESINSVPGWVARMGLLRVWVFFQDLFYFRKPSLFERRDKETNV